MFGVDVHYDCGQSDAIEELQRLRGEVLLMGKQGSRREAEKCCRKALQIAQQAKSWELRASVSLTRLLTEHDRRVEVREILAGIHDWFTEGFDTADLIAAKELLDQLEH
jgi:predicted ATPase